MLNPMDLSGRTVLVTGASSGIGNSTATQLSHLGANVILVARNGEKLRETLSLMAGGDHKMVPFDLTQIGNIEGLVKDIVNDSGALDGLVHCAGIAPMRPLQLTTHDYLQQVMLVNFYAFIELVRVVSKRKHYNEGASFIGISSVMSRQGEKACVAYCASKGALDSAIRPLAQELAAKKIRVNTVVPSFIKTDMYAQYAESAGEADLENTIISRQYLGLGEPIDVANAIAYLLSDASKFITGTSLVVDGGYLS